MFTASSAASHATWPTDRSALPLTPGVMDKYAAAIPVETAVGMEAFAIRVKVVTDSAAPLIEDEGTLCSISAPKILFYIEYKIFKFETSL